MAEPIEWALAGEAVVLGGYALEGLGLIGTAAEAGAAGGLALETASAGAGSIAALDDTLPNLAAAPTPVMSICVLSLISPEKALI